MYATTRHMSTKKFPSGLVAAKRADYGGEAAKPDGGRQEEIRYTKEDLTEVREVNVPGVVLQVGVGHERHYRVQDRGRGEHALALRIKRHPGLERQHDITKHEQHAVED